MSDKQQPTPPFIHTSVVTDKGIKHNFNFPFGKPAPKKWKQGGKPRGRKINKNT